MTKVRPRGRTTLATLATAVLVVGLTSPPGSASADPGKRPTEFSARPLSPTDRVSAGKSPSSRLAQTSPGLLRRDDARPARVMIKLDYDGSASYAGGVGGLRATSPSVTGRQLTGQSATEAAYAEYVRAEESQFRSALAEAVPSARVTGSYRLVYGGVAAVIPANSVERILRMDGVAAVQSDRLAKPLTDSSPQFIGAPAAYQELGTTQNAGAGLIYGNLDTGIWPEHPSFADQGNLAAPPGPARECTYGDNPLTPAADPFVCQNKLIGGADFTDSYDECVADGDCAPDPYDGTARDGDGHGTHTSSTSAGNILQSAEVLGVDRGPLQGVAPGAWVMEYKVCGFDGCFDSDSAAAVEQAILDGVDVINFSISGGTTPFSDPVELAFLDAYAAGVFVSTSAGNSGPGAGTANHLSPWVTSVGASTQTREFATTLELQADNGDTFTADGASITDGAGPAPVVLAGDVPGYGDPQCGAEPASDTIFEGMIVACARGGQARVWKGFVAYSGGAEGMVLYNPTLADVETDNHWLPTVHLPDGTDFVAFMGDHTGVTGSFAAGEKRNGQGDVMAAFSSRGPAGLFIKPDVTAPGVQILAGASPTPPAPDPVSGGSPPGELFQAIAGTSMSSPHVAGAALLARAVHGSWTPGQTRSALMTTALEDVLKEDTTTPADPFDMGAGRIRLNRTIYAPLTIDETPENFFAMGNDPVQAVHLNMPSINAPIMPGRLTTTRVVTNASGVRERYRAVGDAPAASRIRVSPSNFTVAPGESRTLTITIESDAPVGEQQFGAVRLVRRNGGGRLHLPVAFVHTQGSVNLTQSCSPSTIQQNGQSVCTVEGVNNSFEEQVVDLDTFTSRNPKLRIIDVDGATQLDQHHARLHNVTLAGAAPGVPSLGPSGFAGYLPLALFGVSPEPIGDEEIINFDTPAFEFAGQSWDRLGVDSNGYLIVGGGSAEDNNCCNLPAGPDPERPNNVLAPLWSDLDGTGSPGIFIATLTDATTGDEWLVVEYQVTDFAGTEPRVFQVWLGLNGVEDITFDYNPANPQYDLTWDFLVGAENQLGEGEMAPVLPTESQRVESSDLVPGDGVGYTVTVRGVDRGVGEVRTEMEASRSPGVIVETDLIRVIRRR